MAETVAEALEQRCHAVIEAPTGVGKSFAYLVPAIQHALATGSTVVVSTATIALQEQLMGKDIPLLQRLFPTLKAELVKGRNNYLSRRRLDVAYDGQEAFLESREQVAELKEIRAWAAESQQGDRQELSSDPTPVVWRAVQSEADNCMGRRCPCYEACFYYRMRARANEAHLLVVNHHLYFADLAIREDAGGILPPHQVVVFDEAHTLEDIASEYLGESVSDAQVRFFLDGLWQGGRHKGLLAVADEANGAGRAAVEAARAANAALWATVFAAVPPGQEEHHRLNHGTVLDSSVCEALVRVAEALRRAAELAGEANRLQELNAQAERAGVLAGTLRRLIAQERQQYVHYASIPPAGRRGSPSLNANPLDVSGLLKERLFNNVPVCVLTSATLAADDSERFLFLRKRLGLEGGLAKRLDSPFDFQRQARLLINATAIDPKDPAFDRRFAQWIGDYLDGADGGTFVLFTSYKQLNTVYELLAPRLERARRFVLRQGDRMTRREMLANFRRAGDAILFGTSSFWEGVDVPGDALKNVIIAKLPFENPSHPVTKARLDEITRRGGNAFMERSVPEAILRLKQGVGRLIRTPTDTGTIVLADSRILASAYGRYFLRALPSMPVEQFRFPG
jgi:ATP-dependent DNA helicase DinG